MTDTSGPTTFTPTVPLTDMDALARQLDDMRLNPDSVDARTMRIIQLSLMAFTNNANTTKPKPEFKRPSVAPPRFDGSVMKLVPYECQARVAEYLAFCEQQCRYYGFRADDEVAHYENHLTYVDWLQGGLKETAFHVWQLLPKAERQTMTWTGYQKWIQDHFQSKLAYARAVAILTSLKQRTSARDYAFRFNNILYSIGEHADKTMICTIFRNGLKPEIASNSGIDSIDTDLSALQQEAIRLDELAWNARQQNRTTIQTATQRPAPTFGNKKPIYEEVNDPMEVDNTERLGKPKKGRPAPLTEKERAEYRENGWCTFCRRRDHTIDKCQHPNKRSKNATGASLQKNEAS
ncbi:hypothetical protein HK405_012260 [Cladochytrium tenue]|nr:hypothetical protein HK405_012260 [Cladochytrium tenue]